MKSINTTLLLVVKDDKILLAEKKRGFGAGKINGTGGKVEPSENVETAMLREAKEELGIVPVNYQNVATIDFDEYVKGERENVIMNVFVATDYIGEEVETEEMKPVWVDLHNIPYHKMLPDDRYWLPLVLDGKSIDAKFTFDEEFNLLSYDIQERIKDCKNNFKKM